MSKTTTSSRSDSLGATRVRLFEWGNCIRSVTFAGAPYFDCYTQQPFLNERVNFDFAAVSREIFFGKRFERAIEVDNLLTHIRENSAKNFIAVVIRYVEREHGGLRKLTLAEQVFMFNQRAQLSKDSYYRYLLKVEKYIAMGLGYYHN